MNTVSTEEHNALVQVAYEVLGFKANEVDMCAASTRQGNGNHNALRGLHLHDLFGSRNGACIPGAEIEVIENRFSATEIWNFNKKLGQAIAKRAFNRPDRETDLVRVRSSIILKSH